MKFYENCTTSRKHHLEKNRKKYNLLTKKLALCIKFLEKLKYKKWLSCLQKCNFMKIVPRTVNTIYKKLEKNTT